eukprot:CAMPEP_0195280606 /NCGR_PEP_ID=MMETSP0707-20130614/215_1 /TAXON_ID=33640 /ORGANISM="Asterionellopsis glacialis, Strain CCMP134" /LENGTH=396 /DNA_ID=CAMNT_0040339377 /DNA_START=181 /DNA_END=1368 /DNA_ORIENTATION=-
MNEAKSRSKWLAWIACLSVTLASLLIANVPVEYALPSKYILPQPTQEADVTSGGSYNEEEVMMASGLTATYGPLGFPLVLSPHDHNSKFHTIDQLCEWVASHEDWIMDKLYVHGAVLFRGFTNALVTPSDFQQFALTMEPHLEKSYLGTSTRTVQEGTTYVHSASDYEGWRIIPAHLEMSFLPTLPARIFFFAHAPNQGSGGETPLVDFRQVYRDLVDKHPALVDEFKQRQIQYIRKYHDNTQGPCYDYFIHKDWQSMFNTTNATSAGERAMQAGFHWSFDHVEETPSGTTSYKGTMKLVHSLPTTRIHPHTQDEIWSNHMNVLHVDSIPAEFAYSAQHLRSWKYVCLYYGFELWVLFQKHIFHGGKASEMGHHVTHQDGSEMNSDYVNTIKQTVW